MCVSVCVCVRTCTHGQDFTFCSHDSQCAVTFRKKNEIPSTFHHSYWQDYSVCVWGDRWWESPALWSLLMHNRIMALPYTPTCTCVCVSRAVTNRRGSWMINSDYICLCLYLSLHLSLQPSGPSLSNSPHYSTLSTSHVYKCLCCVNFQHMHIGYG